MGLPEQIVEGSIKAQRAILSGYKDNPKTNKRKFKEALTPEQVAISLTGEPTLYRHLGELIQAFERRGFTTFLVSNGTVPTALANLSHEPTQLYISLCAPNEGVFKQVCRPLISEGREKAERNFSLFAQLQMSNRDSNDVGTKSEHEECRGIHQNR